MSVPPNKRADRRRGAAMLLAMVVLASLLLGGTIGAWMRVVHTRTSGQAVTAARALSCAEAGLAAAREYMLLPANTGAGRWNALLAAGTLPLPLIAAPGANPYTVVVTNNRFEFPRWDSPPFADSPTDNDGLVALTSTCTDANLAVPISVTRILRHPLSSFPTVAPPTGGSTAAP